MNQKDKKQLQKVRKTFKKEIKRLKVSDLKLSLHADYKTKKLKIVYSIITSQGSDLHNKPITKKKTKSLYLKNVGLYEEKVLVVNLPKFVERIRTEVEKSYLSIGTNEDKISYWQDIYVNQPMRDGTIEVTEKTLETSNLALNYLKEYLEVYDKKYLNIWEWTDDGKKCMTRFLRYKKTNNQTTKNKKVWSDGTTKTMYGHIKAFFNWLHYQVEGFPYGLVSNIRLTPYKPNTKSFNDYEIGKIKDFINDKRDDKQWSWFIKMLMVMLETGVRISEVCKMKIDEINPQNLVWTFVGKGRYGGKERSVRIPSYVWDEIEELVVNEDGFKRTDKEYVFHSLFYKVQDKVKYPDSWIKTEDKTTHISDEGFRKRFKMMVKELDLGKGLTPHTCRRYFITEMLKKTNGNIPLVAELVGHSDWSMVKRYTKSVLLESSNVNVGLFDTNKVSIPIMITKKMRVQLKDLGYTEGKIKTLLPEQAHEIIQRGF
jgi:integrase